MEVVTNNWFTKKYPIGFALSGGFIKGFAHLGAMQSLLEHDIKPNILSGVSAGALKPGYSTPTAMNRIKFLTTLPGTSFRT